MYKYLLVPKVEYIAISSASTTSICIPVCCAQQGLWFGGRQLICRNFSRTANTSSQRTGTVKCRRKETERDCDDMIECLGSAGKKVNTQAQRGRMSKEARAVDRWGQSPTYTASYDPRETERSSFRSQRSRSQNRSLVRGWGKRVKSLCVEAQSLAQGFGVRWKGRPQSRRFSQGTCRAT